MPFKNHICFSISQITVLRSRTKVSSSLLLCLSSREALKNKIKHVNWDFFSSCGVTVLVCYAQGLIFF